MSFRDFFRGARLLQTLHSVSRTTPARGLGFLLGGTGLALGGWFAQNGEIHPARVLLAEQQPAASVSPQILPGNPAMAVGPATSKTASSSRKSERAAAGAEGSDPTVTTTTTVVSTTVTTAPVYSAAWDENWDRRAHTKPRAVRHLILIRHGQYYTEEKDPALQRLTQLGSEQAIATGHRLSSYPHRVTVIHHSNMTRAKETTQIIARFLPNVPLLECPLLAEGGPVTPIPGPSSLSPDRDERYYRDGPRIEAAFRKHFHRADPAQEEDSYEIIVGHANVIRYFVCRALQLAPEAWLRISLNHCGMTFVDVKPSGRVVLRGLGDTGHLDFAQITTS